MTEVTFGKMALPVLQSLVLVVCVTIALIRTNFAIDYSKVNKLIKLSEVKNVLYIDGCSTSCVNGIEEIYKQNVAVLCLKNPTSPSNLPKESVYDFILITTENRSKIMVGKL